MKLNPWIYVAICLFGSVLLVIASGVGEDGSMATLERPWFFVAATLLIWLLTHPLGVLGQVLLMPLVFMGIATPVDAFLAALPIAVGMGYVQWYIVVPRYLCCRKQ